MWRYADIRTVPDIVRYWSAAAPQRVTLVQGPRQMTYRELDDRSSQIASALLDAGAGHGSHIGFLGKNSAEFFAVWLGANKAGGAIAPFNWRSSPAELVDLVDDARPPFVFVSDELRVTLEEVSKKCRSVFEVVSFSPTAARTTLTGG